MKIFKQLTFFVVCGMLAVLPFTAEGQLDEETNPLVGKTAPDFTLMSVSGEKLSLNKFREEDPAIVYFWATWCPHCQTEFKALDRLQKGMREQGIKILLVNLEETPQQIKEFLVNYDLEAGVVIDERSEIADLYRLIGVPTIFYIGKNGKILAVDHEFSENFSNIFSKS